jgi:RHS repeat-associated protein
LFADGTVRANLRYDPWGKQRWASQTTPTRYRFTAQRFDDKLGLYDYNARYYDANIGRFISADVIVPGTSRLTPLTVGFHETMFIEQANGENAQLMQLGPVFRWSARQKQELGTTHGPAVPQTLNRFAYALGNPLAYTDPTGHSSLELTLTAKQAQELVDWILGNNGELGIADVLYQLGQLGVLTGLVLGLLTATLTGGNLPLGMLVGFLVAAGGEVLKETANTLRAMASLVEDEINKGTDRIRIELRSGMLGETIVVHGQRSMATPSPRFYNQAGRAVSIWMLFGNHGGQVVAHDVFGTYYIRRNDGSFASGTIYTPWGSYRR